VHLAEFFEHNVSNLRAHPADKMEKLLPSEWKKLNAKTYALFIKLMTRHA